MASARLSLRLPEELREGLESLVLATGRSESDLAREAIEEYLRRHGTLPSSFDLAQQSGLLGCIESHSGDLSTHPRHMEGFGR